MKITIVTIGSRGDVQPFVALGIGLKQAGYEVTILTHRVFESLVRSYGLDFAVTEGNPQEFIESEEGKKMLESGNNPIKFLRLFAEALSPTVDRIMSDAWQTCQQTDVVIAHTIVYWTYYLAKKLDIPYFLASFTPLTPTTKYPAAMGSGRSLGGLSNYLSYPLSSFLFWQVFRKPVNRWLQSNLNMSPRSIWRSPLNNIKQQQSPILYQYSNYVLPKPKNSSDKFEVTGYWFLEPRSDWTPPTNLVDFLNSGSPPIYIGFGSMSSRDPQKTTKIALAALEKTQQRSIISTGWSGIGNADLPNNILKIDSMPHYWLFPNCAAVVHHGGAGTTAAGLRAGVPSIILPFFADQPFWGQRVADLGVGTKPILQQELTAEKLAAAIETAVNNQQMRDRATQLGEQIRSENGVKAAVEAIDRHLKSLELHSL